MNARFQRSANRVHRYDPIEFTALLDEAVAGNPFVDGTIEATVGPVGKTRQIAGFCDDSEGRTYVVRYMPTVAGRHEYTVTVRTPAGEATSQGHFEVTEGKRPGLLRVDRKNPWHFQFEGNGEHFFWNSTTTYALLGWQERAINYAVNRLHKLGVNRIRVALSPARVKSAQAWGEPVGPRENFTFLFGPWPAANPDDVENPGWDTERFDLAFWHRVDHLLNLTRKLDMQVSLIFYLDGARPGVYPFGADPAGELEQRYYAYAAARCAAYANVHWDVTNEWKLFRDAPWVERMGGYLRSVDPYGHLISVHGHEDFPFRTSPWCDLALFQMWDEHGGHAFMLKNRAEQAATGRPIPQVNEEYGYENHYPQWGGGVAPPGRDADSRRRIAWGIAMAGCYQTTGERADNGLGGWVNGMGDESMVMLEGYRHLRSFFERFPYWKLEPHDDLVDGDAYCLALPGTRYVVYLPTGEFANVRLEGGPYRARRYDPRSGEWKEAGTAEGPTWSAEGSVIEGQDLAYLLERQPA